MVLNLNILLVNLYFCAIFRLAYHPFHIWLCIVGTITFMKAVSKLTPKYSMYKELRWVFILYGLLSEQHTGSFLLRFDISIPWFLRGINVCTTFSFVWTLVFMLVFVCWRCLARDLTSGFVSQHLQDHGDHNPSTIIINKQKKIKEKTFFADVLLIKILMPVGKNNTHKTCGIRR